VVPKFDHRDKSNLSRHVRPTLSADCSDADASISYVDFIQRATSTRDHKYDWEKPRDQGTTETKSDCDSTFHHRYESIYRPGNTKGKNS